MSELFGPIDAVEHPELKASSIEALPQKPKAAFEQKSPVKLGHHKIKQASKPMITVTLPMSVLTSSTRLLGTLAKKHVFTPISGLGWATMGAINTVFKTISSKEKLKPLHSIHLSVEEFKKLPINEKDDIVFLVFDSPSLFISQEKKEAIRQAVRNGQAEGLIQELLEYYSNLPAEEKYKITPTNFRSLDELEKIKALRLVTKAQNNISQEESDELSQFCHMRVRQDSSKLTEEEKERLEKLIISTFNKLPPSVKNKINNFSYEQIEELSQEDKRILFNFAFVKVAEKGTNNEKAHFAFLKKSNQFDNTKDLKILSSCLNRYLSSKEKETLLGSLKEQFAVIRLSLEDLIQLVEQTEAQIKALPETASTIEREKLHTQLDILTKYEKEHAAREPIDMRKILQYVGPQVVTKEFFYDVDIAGKLSLHQIGLHSATFFTAIASSNLHFWTECLGNKTAVSLELLSAIPFGKNLIKSLLIKSGAPADKVEAAFSTMTITSKEPKMIPQGVQAIIKTIEILGNEASKKSQKSSSAWNHWITKSIEAIFDTISKTDLAKGLSGLLSHFAKMAAKAAKRESIQEGSHISKKIFLELKRSLEAIIKKNDENHSFTQFITQIYQSSISPMINNAISSMEALHEAPLAASSVDTNLQVEQEIKQFLLGKAKVASQHLTQEERASFNEALSHKLHSALPLLDWLFTNGQSFALLSFIIHRMLPHMLKSAATYIGKNSQPFWLYMAKSAQHFSSKGSIKSSALKEGSWLQNGYKTAVAKITGNEGIDPKRIENFLKLTIKEQHHLFEIALHSSKITAEEQEIMSSVLATIPEQHHELQTVIELSLKVIDRLTSQELLALSPTSFFTLDKTLQHRIREIVYRYTKCSPSQILSAAEIVKRFNALTENKKAELKSLTIKEFFTLSNEAKEDLFFAVTHSERYKHFTDSDSARIVKKYNALPEECSLELFCPSEKHYKKLSLSDQEKVRMTIAIHADSLKSMVLPTLLETMEWESQMAWNIPSGWELQQFKSLNHISNHRLKNILTLYSTLSEQEQQILTPNRLKEMGKSKIHQVIAIIQTYHPELPGKYHLNITRLEKILGKTPFLAIKKEQEEGLKALCSIFNSLPSGQKAELLQMTLQEFQSLEKDEQKELILLFSDQTADDTMIVSHFNELDRFEQAEWRQKWYVAKKQRESLLESIEHEIDEINKKLYALEKKISRFSNSFSTHLHELQVEWQTQLLALRRLSEKEEESLPIITEEHLQTTKMIDAIIETIVNEMVNITKKALLNTLEKKIDDPTAFNQNIGYARALFNEVYSIYKPLDGQDIVGKQHFRFKLNRALFEKFREMELQFEKELLLIKHRARDLFD